MKSAIIFYFSGTGNTQIVAGMLQDELIKRQYTVDIFRIEDVLKKKTLPDLGNADLIGIGSQVIGFGTPALVRKFVKILPKAQGKKVFVFRTAGGVAPVNYNASRPMTGILSRKGYDVFYERIFSIGSNWISKFDDSVMQKLYEATGKKAGFMCDELIREERRVLKTGFFMRVGMGFVMRMSSLMLKIAGKDYKANSSCTHCGLCVKNCPAGNIVDKDGKIKFKLSCNMCMRYVYSCPMNALHLRKFSFFEVPGGYSIKKILSQPSAETSGKPAPRFFEAYLQNDGM